MHLLFYLRAVKCLPRDVATTVRPEGYQPETRRWRHDMTPWRITSNRPHSQSHSVVTIIENENMWIRSSDVLLPSTILVFDGAVLVKRSGRNNKPGHSLRILQNVAIRIKEIIKSHLSLCQRGSLQKSLRLERTQPLAKPTASSTLRKWIAPFIH